MKKWSLLLIGLSLSTSVVNAFAETRCTTYSANSAFSIWDSTCQAVHFYTPNVYYPDFKTDLHATAMAYDKGGCGGPRYLRGTDDYGNQLYAADEYTGRLLPTETEHFPSGYPVGTATLKIETQDKIGNPQVCQYSFTRTNSSVEMCSVESNPDYCDLDENGIILMGAISAEDKKTISKNAHKLVEKVRVTPQKN